MCEGGLFRYSRATDNIMSMPDVSTRNAVDKRFSTNGIGPRHVQIASVDRGPFKSLLDYHILTGRIPLSVPLNWLDGVHRPMML